MDLNPDSILAVLSSIDTTDLSSHDRALCDLLYVQALDKTDSLAASPFSGVSRIASAFNYFDHKGSDREKMLANFYRGRCYFYNDEYEEAMTYGMPAHELAVKVNDDYWIAKTAEFIADIHSFSHAYQIAWKFEKIAIRFYLKAGKISNYRYALADHGLSLFSGGLSHQGIRLCDSIRNIAEAESDFSLATYAYQYLFSEYIENKDYDKAFDVYTRLKDLNFHFTNSSYLSQISLLYAVRGEEEKARYFLNTAKPLLITGEDSLNYYYAAWIFYDIKNDVILRSVYVDSILQVQNNTIFHLLQRPPLRASETFYHVKAIKEHYNSTIRLALILLVVPLLIILIIVGILLYRYRIKIKETEILELSLNLESLIQRDNILSGHILEVLGFRFDMINLLIEDTMGEEENDGNRKRVFKLVEKEIKSWITPNKVKLVETTLNKYLDDACSRLRQQCPFINEEDFKIIFYLWGGFSIKSISYLLDYKQSSLYTFRRRMMQKIKSSDAPDKDFFIRLFN